MNKKFLSTTVAALVSLLACSAHASTNLVANGDFSEGNVGFTSQYTYVAPAPGALYPETLYTIASNPYSVHPSWVNLTDGKTRLIVNGATGKTATVWEEDDLNTVAGQNYEFSASAANICCNSTFKGENDPSHLEFEISDDGFKTFSDLADIITHPPDDAGQFQTVATSFIATGPVDLRLVDQLSGQSGNDFAVNDISISAAPEPSTWALMIAGVAGIGFAFRQAKKNHAFNFARALAG